jgi:hypothetical protein
VIRLSIANMAGVPSIVYGLFGSVPVRHHLGFNQSLLAGALTLGLPHAPIIITSTEESLRQVPSDLRQASWRLGRHGFAPSCESSAGRSSGHRDRLDPGPVASRRRDRTDSRDGGGILRTAPDVCSTASWLCRTTSTSWPLKPCGPLRTSCGVPRSYSSPGSRPSAWLLLHGVLGKGARSDGKQRHRCFRSPMSR